MRKLLIILFISLTACAGSYWERQENARHEEIIRLGEEAKQKKSNPNEASYKEGSVHGCQSGRNVSGSFTSFQKNIDEYVKNPYYKSGWDDGFSKCKAQGDRDNRAIDDAVNKSVYGR